MSHYIVIHTVLYGKSFTESEGLLNRLDKYKNHTDIT